MISLTTFLDQNYPIYSGGGAPPVLGGITIEETTWRSIQLTWDSSGYDWDVPWIIQRSTSNSWTNPSNFLNNQAADNTGAGTFRFLGLNAGYYTDLDGLNTGTTYYYRVAPILNLPTHLNTAATPIFGPWKYGAATTGTLEASKRQVFVVTDLQYAGGADDTGVNNCREAIQAALDAAEAVGGGDIYLPTGVYKVYPETGTPYIEDNLVTTEDTDSYGRTIFEIGSDNIRFIGDGPGNTIINCRLWLDRPATEWVQVKNASNTVVDVHRFIMFEIMNHQHFTLKDMTINGGGTPVNTGKSVGLWNLDYARYQWDTSHKLIGGFSANARSRSRFTVIDNVDTFDWRGEAFFIGGKSQGKWLIKDCEIRRTNSSGISTTADLEVVDSTIAECANACFECNAFNDVTNVFSGAPLELHPIVRGCTLIGLDPGGTMVGLPGDRSFIGIAIFNENGTSQCITDCNFSYNGTGMWAPWYEAYDAFLFNWTYTGNMIGDGYGTGNAILDFKSQASADNGLAGGMDRVYALEGTVNIAHDWSVPNFIHRIQGSKSKSNWVTENLTLNNDSGSTHTISQFAQDFQNLGDETRLGYEWKNFQKTGANTTNITTLYPSGKIAPTMTNVFP